MTRTTFVRKRAAHPPGGPPVNFQALGTSASIECALRLCKTPGDIRCWPNESARASVCLPAQEGRDIVRFNVRMARLEGCTRDVGNLLVQRVDVLACPAYSADASEQSHRHAWAMEASVQGHDKSMQHVLGSVALARPWWLIR